MTFQTIFDAPSAVIVPWVIYLTVEQIEKLKIS